MWELLDGISVSRGTFTPESIVLSLLLAFVLGQFIAWIYYFTHSGLSYSRSFVQSLVLITVIVAMIMAIIGNNLVTAFGLMGALALIRFRNVIKDTRDIVFIFSALVVGMAAGSQSYALAILGTLLMCGIAVYLHVTNFGAHQPHNAFLRFSLEEHIGPQHSLPIILKQFCSDFTLISAQDNGFGSSLVEYAYQVMIKNAANNEKMLSELQGVKGIQEVSLTMQEQLLEV